MTNRQWAILLSFSFVFAIGEIFGLLVYMVSAALWGVLIMFLA